MLDAEIIAAVSLAINLVILLVTALISSKIANLRSLMFERFVTREEFYTRANCLSGKGERP